MYPFLTQYLYYFFFVSRFGFRYKFAIARVLCLVHISNFYIYLSKSITMELNLSKCQYIKYIQSFGTNWLSFKGIGLGSKREGIVCWRSWIQNLSLTKKNKKKKKEKKTFFQIKWILYYLLRIQSFDLILLDFSRSLTGDSS